MACKPGSVIGVNRWMTIPLGHPLPDASRDPPGRQPGNRQSPSLFGLAPGGACRAASVAARAVRSCRTVSPLPDFAPCGASSRQALTACHAEVAKQRRRAVCSLWRFPWGRPRRTLSGTVSPWSPDFPPRQQRAASLEFEAFPSGALQAGRPSGHL